MSGTAGSPLRKGWLDRRGVTSLEFALVAPAFLLLLLGCLYVFLLAFSASALRYAVEEAARCASVRTATCGSDASTRAYATQQYFGLGVIQFDYPPVTPPNPAPPAPSCGKLVQARVTPFGANPTIGNLFNRTITASACFPLNG